MRDKLPCPIPNLPICPSGLWINVLAFEKETLGFYVSGHPLDRFADEVARHSKKNLAELISDGNSVECSVAGIVTECRTRRTKKGDLMAVFTLEDLAGAVETVVFPGTYAKFEPCLSTDSPILVTGRFEAEEEGSYKIIASDIQPLLGISERRARMLSIRAALSQLLPESAGKLYNLFEKNKGDTGIEVELYHPCDFRVTIHSSDFVKVRSSPDLIREIESICGAGSVTVWN